MTWAPPLSNAGTVTIYGSGLASDGDYTPAGDRVYTSQLTLCPVLASGQAKPVITSVVSASGFSASAGIAPGTWIEIYGNNFAAATCLWQTADFNGNSAPTSLGGVGVSIGGKSAYLDYVSTGQINAQVPDGVTTGASVPVIVTNSGGASAAFSVATSATAPALLAPAQPPFTANAKQYAVALTADGTFEAIPSHPAKAGDVVTLYGIGFGLPGAGMLAQEAASLGNIKFALNQTPMQVLYGGVAPSFVGLYQFNVITPAVAAGDYRLNVSLDGVGVKQTLFFSVAP